METKKSLILKIALTFLVFYLLIYFAPDRENKKAIVLAKGNTQEQCESISDLGLFKLQPDSKKFIPYTKEMTKVVFKDRAGKEYIGRFKQFDDRISRKRDRYQKPCPIDTCILISYLYEFEEKAVWIEFEELEILLITSLSSSLSRKSFPRKLVTDFCHITLSNTLYGRGGGFNSYVNIPVYGQNNFKDCFRYSSFEKEFDIHGKTFKDVYIQYVDGDNDHELFYNEEFGFIGFRNPENPAMDMVFDRME